jgi:hypothetical protein
MTTATPHLIQRVGLLMKLYENWTIISPKTNSIKLPPSMLFTIMAL